MSLAAIFGLVLWTLLFGIVLVVGGLRTSVPAQARCARASSDCRRYSGAMLKVGSIVLRVEDLSRQTVFWSAALDYETRIDRHDFVLLAPRDGTGPNMSLDIAPSEVHVPPRIHLDLYTEDQAAEVQRLVGLGTSEVHWVKRPADADYVILADPEGKRFCGIDAR